MDFGQRSARARLEITDSSFEGILWVTFEDQSEPDCCFKLCVCYLPPEGSSIGNTAQEFYETLLYQVYLYFDDDPVLLTGDFNSRMSAAKQDFNPGIDIIPPRCGIDTENNKFGEYLIDFLKDSNMCVVNGRFDSAKDNFTHISNRGKSVVDYFVVPYVHINLVNDFEVKTMTEVLNEFCLSSTTGKPPDHSLICCTIKLSGYVSQTTHPDELNEPQSGTVYRRYDVTRLPINLFDNEHCRNALCRVVDHLLHTTEVQENIDSTYEAFITCIHSEMDENLLYKDIGPNMKKRSKNRSKPWWNQELNELWAKTCRSEKMFLQCKGSRSVKRGLRETFTHNRRLFDKRLRQAERQYYAIQRQKITEMQTGDPKSFWDEIHKLGPGKAAHDFSKVRLGDDSYSRDPGVILNKWKHDFEQLLNCQTDREIDTNLLSQIQNISAIWEDEYATFIEQNQADISRDTDNSEMDGNPIDTSYLNNPITVDETKNALNNAKKWEGARF